MIDSIIAYLEQIDPILAALYATLFTWLVTAVGVLFGGVAAGIPSVKLGVNSMLRAQFMLKRMPSRIIRPNSR